MGKDVGRNDPCPCGSGKKYKHCHEGKALPSEGPKGKMALVPLLVGAVGIAGVALGVWVGMERGLGDGIAVGAGVLLLVAIYFFLRNPPPPGASGGNDPAGMNFGR